MREENKVKYCIFFYRAIFFTLTLGWLQNFICCIFFQYFMILICSQNQIRYLFNLIRNMMMHYLSVKLLKFLMK